MTAMIGESYDALIEVGSSEDKSRRAAEAIAPYPRSSELAFPTDLAVQCLATAVLLFMVGAVFDAGKLLLAQTVVT